MIVFDKNRCSKDCINYGAIVVLALAISVLLCSPIHASSKKLERPKRPSQQNRRDLDIIKQWVDQLNIEATNAFKSTDNEGRKATIHMALRLVYGIDSQLKKIGERHRSEKDLYDLYAIRQRLNHYAWGFCYQHSAFWRKPPKDVIGPWETPRTSLNHQPPWESPRASQNHGEVQLKAMLRDRPLMAKWVSVGDPIWNWTVDQFNGHGIPDPGLIIFWDAEQPTTPFTGEHESDIEYAIGKIRVAAYDEEGHAIQGEEQWSSAVFELYNIRGAKDFDQVNEDALDGLLSKDEYIRRNTFLEFIAVQHTKMFYKTMWHQHAVKRRLRSDDFYWKSTCPNDYEEWIARYKSQSPSKYIDDWGDYYKTEILPYVTKSAEPVHHVRSSKSRKRKKIQRKS